MPDGGDLIDVVVIGAGVMGRHHARVVAQHPDCRLVAVVDCDAVAAASLAEVYGARALSRAPSWIDAAVIATPATTHVDVARPLIDASVPVLVEKPLADSVEGAIALCAPGVAVGLVERLNPAVPTVLSGTEVDIVRAVPPSVRGRDVDVLLDLAQHDLDLLDRWSRGEEPEVLAGHYGVDRVDLTLAFGALRARCRWDRMATVPERRMRLGAPGASMVCDLLASARCRVDGLDPLQRQWEGFLAMVRGHGEPVADAAAGLRAVRMATAARLALATLGLAACDSVQRTWDGVYVVDAYSIATPCDAEAVAGDFGASHLEVDVGRGNPRPFSIYGCDDPECNRRVTRWFGAVDGVDDNALVGFLSSSLWSGVGGVGSCSSYFGDIGAARTPRGDLTLDLAHVTAVATGLDTASCFELAGDLAESGDCGAIEHVEAHFRDR